LPRRLGLPVQLVSPGAEPVLDDADLVRAFSDGESWAARAIWSRHAPMVYRLLERALGPSGEAEDLTQDVFLRTFSKLPTLRDVQALRSFIYSVALRTLKWELRRRRVRRILRLSDTGHLPDLPVRGVDSESRQILSRFYGLLEQLPVNDRTAFVLRHMEGALVLAGFGGIRGAVMPVGRVRVALGERLRARVTLSGLGTRPQVDAAEGTATVRQELGLLELIGEIAPQSWLQPAISLGAGAYHIGVDGSANWPYAGLHGGSYAFAADAGVGLALSITSSFALSLEGHALLVTPYPVIRFLDVDTAQTGRPLLSGALTLVGWL